MKFSAYIYIATLFMSCLAYGKPFPGHVRYTVDYSKPFKDATLPQEITVDFYVKGDKKLIITDTFYDKERKLIAQLFDDRRKMLIAMDLTAKVYTVNPYDSLPNIDIEEIFQKAKSKPEVVLGNKLNGKFFRNKKNLNVYAAWYSDYRSSAFGPGKLDSEHIIDKETGNVALLLTRQVSKDITAAYVATKIDNKIDETFFELPKNFKILKR
jgi:hypothetical protein